MPLSQCPVHPGSPVRAGIRWFSIRGERAPTPAGDTWQRPEMVLVVPLGWGVLLTCRGWRPGTLLNAHSARDGPRDKGLASSKCQWSRGRETLVRGLQFQNFPPESSASLQCIALPGSFGVSAHSSEFFCQPLLGLFFKRPTPAGDESPLDKVANC